MTPAKPSLEPRRIVRRGAEQFALVDEGPTDSPSPRSAIAVHGLPGSVRDFRWFAPCVADRMRLVRLDMPGFGQTSATMAAPTAAAAATHIARVADALGVERTVLVAHSYGALVAVTAAARYPDLVDGLVLIAPVGLRPHRGLRQMPVPGLIAAGLRTPLVRQPLMAGLEKAYAAAGFRHTTPDEIERTLAAINRWDFNAYRRRVRRLQVPVMCAWADDDPLVEPTIVDELLAELPDGVPQGPRLHFDTGGHNLQKTRAVEISEAMMTWLEP
ncbi:alpha/beta hydrolase [Persicimonas caeni]|uniref:Alpha/beta hydrolase n=1 Tax=Persicimonas caeni TaxID=2292766 RepID=A0A4Y6PZ15_PERCE|nr:alpha/beta fold hydrolase [Persicimonas caeni]QDG53558.1 alpha/beta hydrolase [Persicimonas caeni]QED34779.1 alpha/beta hydrolase [Persicimonas caeni]